MSNVKGAFSIFVIATLGLGCGSGGPKSQGSDKGGQGGTSNLGGTLGQGGSGSLGGSTSPGSAGSTGTGGSVAGGTGGVNTGGSPAGGTGGTSGTICPLIACPAIACASGMTIPNPDNPCGCPVCAPTDAGAGADAGTDAGCVVGPCPLLPVCPAGSHFVTPPCGCTTCEPLDAGQSDATVCPPHSCPPMAACVSGNVIPDPSNPCGCLMCAPVDAAADGAVATDSTSCTWPASLNPRDASDGQCTAARAYVNCTFADGSGELCLSDDPTGCPNSPVSPGGACQNQCSSTEYAVQCGKIGPSSFEAPAGCRMASATPGGIAFYCCPCAS